MKTVLLFFFFALTDCFSFAQSTCGCDSLFTDIKKKVTDNYPGYSFKVTKENEISFQAFTNSVTIASKNATSDSSCFVVIKKWLSFFHDHHLSMRIKTSKNGSGKSVPSITPATPLKISITAQEIANYFSSAQLNAVEGYWRNDNYQVAVVKRKNSPDIFDGIVLSSSNEDWAIGETKFILTRQKNIFQCIYFTGDKTPFKKKAFITKNILDIEIAFFERENYSAGDKLNFTEYSYNRDTNNPAILFPKKDLALIRLKDASLGQGEKIVFDSIINTNKEVLNKTPYWIIDLRDNEGGDVSIATGLFPYIYTDPILDWNTVKKTSESNITTWFDTYIKNYYENSDSTVKDYYDKKMAHWRLHANELYADDKNAADTIVFEKATSFPKKIIILINKNTASSGELFAIMSSSSKKVEIHGENSAGIIDSDNILTYTTSCSNVKLTIPFGIRRWFEKGISYDKTGIIPYKKYGNTNENWIEKAYLYMQTGVNRK